MKTGVISREMVPRRTAFLIISSVTLSSSIASMSSSENIES